MLADPLLYTETKSVCFSPGINTHDVLKRWHLEFVASLSSAILIACWDTTDRGFFSDDSGTISQTKNEKGVVR